MIAGRLMVLYRLSRWSIYAVALYLFIWPVQSHAALSIAWAGVPVKDDASGTSSTTASFNSTGYTHIVVGVNHEGAPTTLTLSDNKGSSGPTGLTKINHTNGNLNGQLIWMKIASPGSGHTVTITWGASRPYRNIGVWLVNSGTGELALDVETGAGGTSSPADAGSLATTTATASVLWVANYDSVTWTASTGWTENYDNGSFGGSRTDASGTLDPQATPSLGLDWVAVAASFKESGGGGGGGTVHNLMMMGIGQ